MRQHPAAAVDLPRPHLAKETAAIGDGGGAAARRAAAPAGHLMQESAMDWATKPGVERMGIGMTSWRRGRVLGFYRAYRRTEGDKATEEQRRQGLLRSPRGSREPASRSSAAQAGRAQIKKYEDACGQRRSFVGLGSKTQELFLACARNTRKSGALTPRL